MAAEYSIAYTFENSFNKFSYMEWLLSYFHFL